MSAISDKIEAYHDKRIGLDELTQFMVGFKFKVPRHIEDAPDDPNAMLSFVEDQSYEQDDTWDEVNALFNLGWLSKDDYHHLHQSVYDAHADENPEEKSGTRAGALLAWVRRRQRKFQDQLQMALQSRDARAVARAQQGLTAWTKYRAQVEAILKNPNLGYKSLADGEDHELHDLSLRIKSLSDAADGGDEHALSVLPDLEEELIECLSADPEEKHLLGKHNQSDHGHNHYHGTSTLVAKRILKEGLLLKSSKSVAKDGSKAIWATMDKTTAMRYGYARGTHSDNRHLEPEETFALIVMNEKVGTGAPRRSKEIEFYHDIPVSAIDRIEIYKTSDRDSEWSAAPVEVITNKSTSAEQWYAVALIDGDDYSLVGTTPEEEKSGTSEGAKKGWEKRQRARPETAAPEPEGEHAIVFHGSVNFFLDSILKNGIVAGPSPVTGERAWPAGYFRGDRARSVYLDVDASSASSWGEQAAQSHIEKMFKKGIGKLAGENEIQHKLRLTDTARVVVFEVHIPADSKDNLINDEMLSYSGEGGEDAKRYVGPIPPDWLHEYRVYRMGKRKHMMHVRIKKSLEQVYYAPMVVFEDTPAEEKAVRDVSQEPRDSSGKWTTGASSGKTKTAAVEFGEVSPEAKKIISRMGMSPHEFAQIYTGGMDRIGYKTYPLQMNIEGSADGNELLVSGSIDLKDASDDDHTQLVKFERSWRRDRSSDPWVVYHDRLEVDPNIQGSGYGSEMFYKSEDAYRKLGVESIRTNANIDVGGYAWARMGFDFEYADIGRQNIKNSIEAAFVELQRERYQGKKLGWQRDDDIADEIVPVNRALDDLTYPFQFAAFSVKYNGKTVDLGRMGMASSKCSWDAVKYLKKPNSPPNKAGDAYKKKKLSTMKSGAEEQHVVGGQEGHFDIYSPDDAAWMAELREQDNSLFVDLDMGEPEEKSGTSEGAVLGWEARKKHGYMVEPVKHISNPATMEQEPPKTGIHAVERDDLGHGQRIDGMPSYKEWQEPTFKSWRANITDDEQKSIDRYVGTYYMDINTRLRGLPTPQFAGLTDEEANKFIGHMDAAFSKIKTKEDIVVLRGVSNAGRAFEKRMKPGATFIDNAFVSTTIDSITAHSFSASSDELGPILSIHVPRGSRVLPGSNAESEIILDRGSRFKVLSYDPATKMGELELLPDVEKKSEVGDKEGHKFHGNQYTKVAGTSQEETDDEELPDDDENHGEDPEEEIIDTVDDDAPDEDEYNSDDEDLYEQQNDEDEYINPDDRALADAVKDLPVEPVEVNSDSDSRAMIRKYFGVDSTDEQLAQVFTGGLDLLREKLPEGAKLYTRFSAVVNYDDYNDKPKLAVSCRINYSLPGDPPVTVAEFERSFKREYGDLTVQHELFNVAPEFRGTGYGSEMFYQSEDAYRKMGVSRIEVHADIDIGGYAWARMGFAFNNPGSDRRAVRQLLVDKFDEVIRNKMDDDNRYHERWPQEAKDAMRRVEEDLKELDYPYELAAYRVNFMGEDIALGHDAMASSKCDWHGTKSLSDYDDDDPNIRAGEEYKKVKKSSKGKKGKAERVRRAEPTDDEMQRAIGRNSVPVAPVTNLPEPEEKPDPNAPQGALLGTSGGIIGRPESTRAPGYDDEAVSGVDGNLYQYDYEADAWTPIDFESTMEAADGRLIGKPRHGDFPRVVRYNLQNELRRWNWNTNKWVDADDPDAIASAEGRTVNKSVEKSRNGVEAHFDVDSPDDLVWIERLKELGLLGKNKQEKSDTVADFDAEYPQPINATEILSMQSGSFRFRKKKKKKREEKAGTREGALKGWEKRERARKEIELQFVPFANNAEGNAWLNSLIPQGAEPDELYAAGHYKWTSFFNINRILRDGDDVKPTGYADEIDALDRYVARGKTDRDVISFRTLDAFGDGSALRKFANQLEKSKGKTFVDKAFVSTSVHNRGEFFATSSDITMEIRIPKGTPGVPLDQFMAPSDPGAPGRREGEWLLGRNTRFKVHSTRRDRDSRRLHVVLEVMPDERSK